jgi:hypothetical protein
VAERFDDPTVRKTIEVDLGLMTYYELFGMHLCTEIKSGHATDASPTPKPGKLFCGVMTSWMVTVSNLARIQEPHTRVVQSLQLRSHNMDLTARLHALRIDGHGNMVRSR